MLEMKIKIEADAAVLEAINKLATALEKSAVNISVPQDAPAPVAPAAPAQTVAPTNPAPTVPVTTAPTYTIDQIAKAGASLVDAGKMEQLLALLAKYGVQAVTQLQPDQYGVFATELRTLGAQL
nr:MAG TPA: hypothetical protein [Caudoviricetes sp.]